MDALEGQAQNDIEARQAIFRLAGRPAIVVSPFRSVAENLAVDEEMTVSAGRDHTSTLRLWWADAPVVVIGRSENPEVVADLDACARLGVPVLRRRSGGGAVLQAPGVLNYSLTAPAPESLDVRGVFGLGARLLVGAIARLGISAEPAGISDVVVGDRKISGNAQAWRRGGMLLHGTLLRDFNLDLVEACLRHPPREPDYRSHRTHRGFLTTLVRLGVLASPMDVEAAVVSSACGLFGVEFP